MYADAVGQRHGRNRHARHLSHERGAQPARSARRCSARSRKSAPRPLAPVLKPVSSTRESVGGAMHPLQEVPPSILAPGSRDASHFQPQKRWACEGIFSVPGVRSDSARGWKRVGREQDQGKSETLLNPISCETERIISGEGAASLARGVMPARRRSISETRGVLTRLLLRYTVLYNAQVPRRADELRLMRIEVAAHCSTVQYTAVRTVGVSCDPRCHQRESHQNSSNHSKPLIPHTPLFSI